MYEVSQRSSERKGIKGSLSVPAKSLPALHSNKDKQPKLSSTNLRSIFIAMFFKIFTVVAALASLATGSAAAVIEARQVGALATCNIVTTPSNGFTGGSLSEEFIIRKSKIEPLSSLMLITIYFIVFNREFANDLPPENAIVVSSSIRIEDIAGQQS